MKTLNVSDIINDVRIKLDEICLNESEMLDVVVDNTNLNEVIQSCISAAYLFVYNNADASMIEGKSGNVPVKIGANLIGEVILPSDFLRLLSVRLSSWNSSFSKIITENSAEYRMQSNKWIGGSPECPVVAIVHSGSSRKLELYRASDLNDTLTEFIYIPTIDVTYGVIDISDRLYEPFLYYVAGLTLTTFRETASTDMFAIAKGLLNIE